MATKAQERAALEKIRKIVDGLGDESYIGHAMDGVLEDAEQNIENDFWNSYRNRYEYMNVQCEKAEDNLVKANERAKEAERRQKMAEGLLQTKTEEADKWFSKYNEEKARADSAQLDVQDNAAGYESVIKAQELEIIKLKAKLYDMMVGA